MTGRLAGKIAFVTGAGCVGPGWGNGRATCVRFAEEGAKIFAVDRDLDLMQPDQSLAQITAAIFTHLDPADHGFAAVPIIGNPRCYHRQTCVAPTRRAVATP